MFKFNHLNVIYPFWIIALCLFLQNCSRDQVSDEILTSFELVLSIQGNGTVSPDSNLFASNSPVTITATPLNGYYFDRWEGLGELVEVSEYTFLITKNTQIKAIFLPIPTLQDEVELYSPKKIDENPVFMIENGGTKAYLTDKTGLHLNTWNFEDKLGNDLELLEDGSIVGLFKPESISFSFGGYGGILKKFDSSAALVWEYELNNEDYLLHHDFEILPSGNILLIVWEHFNEIEAQDLGFDGEGSIYLEKIIEWNPESRNIVWEWRSVDHLIQDFDPEALNHGLIADHPEKIDLNYNDNDKDNGDLMHANGLFYDPIKDVIFLSVNFYSEVWVISHSNTTDESKTTSGDLKFRFGNSQAHQGIEDRMFYNNHHPSLVKLDPLTVDRFLIFINGSNENQSKVYEFELPVIFDENPLLWSTPEKTWSFTHPDLYYGKISGAYRLSNGNTLICEGDYGYWEVTKNGEVVWKYNGDDKTFWRGYVYP
jgi:hypothetical protein